MGRDIDRALPKEIADELGALGVPYTLEYGGKHIKIKVGGVLAWILPRGNIKQVDKRSVLNTRAQIRRAAQKVTHG